MSLWLVGCSPYGENVKNSPFIKACMKLWPPYHSLHCSAQPFEDSCSSSLWLMVQFTAINCIIKSNSFITCIWVQALRGISQVHKMNWNNSLNWARIYLNFKVQVFLFKFKGAQHFVMAWTILALFGYIVILCSGLQI